MKRRLHPADSRASSDWRRSPRVVTHRREEEVEEGGGGARGTEEEREDRKEKLPGKSQSDAGVLAKGWKRL